MSASDENRAVEVFVDGFGDDPWFRWLWPDDDTYPEHARVWFGLLTQAAAEHSEVILAGHGAAAAIWTPPGASLAHDTRLGMKTALLLRSQLGDRPRRPPRRSRSPRPASRPGLTTRASTSP